jgi:hypothetical protein
MNKILLLIILILINILFILNCVTNINFNINFNENFTQVEQNKNSIDKTIKNPVHKIIKNKYNKQNTNKKTNKNTNKNINKNTNNNSINEKKDLRPFSINSDMNHVPELLEDPSKYYKEKFNPIICMMDKFGYLGANFSDYSNYTNKNDIGKIKLDNKKIIPVATNYTFKDSPAYDLI